MSSREPLNRAPEPPDRAGPRMMVLRLKGNQARTFACLSEVVWGTFIHWNPRAERSTECLENPDICPGCIAKLPSKWRGYICIENTSREIIFLEITPDAYRDIKDAVENINKLRGHRFRARRTAADNGRLRMEHLEAEASKAGLPRDVDPEPTLRMLWSWKKFKGGES